MANIYVDPKYNPNLIGHVTSRTKLAPGIPIAKFSGALGSNQKIEYVLGQNRSQTHRNLYMQAEAIRAINEDQKQFKNVSVTVSEGLYRPFVPGGDGLFPIVNNPKYNAITPLRVSEKSSNTYAGLPDIALLKQNGRAVVYEVIGKDGKVDLEKTFDVALFWKDYLNYDWIILEYDHFSPNARLHAQIVFIVPDIPASFEVQFNGGIATTYNYHLSAMNEFTELKEKYTVSDPARPSIWESENISPPADRRPPPQVSIVGEQDLHSKKFIDLINNTPLPDNGIQTTLTKNVIAKYLGREITDVEYNALLRAVYGEASGNAQERGAVAGVILNRARVGFVPGSNNIIDTLVARNQFQAITGTDKDGHIYSANVGKLHLESDQLPNIELDIINHLESTDRTWMNFTANNPAAYGEGTDIEFLDRLRAQGGEVIGQTIFGTVA